MGRYSTHCSALFQLRTLIATITVKYQDTGSYRQRFIALHMSRASHSSERESAGHSTSITRVFDLTGQGSSDTQHIQAERERDVQLQIMQYFAIPLYNLSLGRCFSINISNKTPGIRTKIFSGSKCKWYLIARE